MKKFFSFFKSLTLCLNYNKFNSVPHPLINPICLLHNIFFSLISFTNLVNIADSINFTKVLDIAICLYYLYLLLHLLFYLKK